MFTFIDMKGQLNIIGDAVRKHRREKGWTQHELAGACQRLGWQLIRETLVKIELGTRRVSDSEVLLLAKALGCSTASLFEDNLENALAVARHSKLEE